VKVGSEFSDEMTESISESTQRQAKTSEVGGVIFCSMRTETSRKTRLAVALPE
jgi:hypothetical protein